MFGERTFQVIIVFSALLHGAILTQRSTLNIPFLQHKKEKVEISYFILKEQQVKMSPASDKKEPLLREDIQSGLRKAPAPFLRRSQGINEEKESLKKDMAFIKPIFNRPDVIAIKKKITLPPVELEKINNPSYIGYYQLVREKIKRAAYQNYSSSETGEVYFSFIISGDGYLQEVRLREEKTSASRYLKEIATQSLISASPFPNFPKELDYPQLSFNVIISFEVE